MSQQTHIGRYELVSELGRGGMATVYRCHDPRFKRDVAVKTLPREFMAQSDFHARFEREAHTIAALDHSAIVPVYDFGEDDGQPFIVMRYMAGGSLSDRVKAGKISLQETARILSILAPGLDEAHSRGIIHRDLKPANILFDQRDMPFLSDFGIVSLADSAGQLTAGGMIGTPAYMAPEMMSRSVTSQADVYALGITFYQMITGNLPYEAPTPMGVMMANVTKPIPSLNDSLPDAPKDLQTVLDRAAAKDPLDRYQTAGEFAADLQSVVSGGGVAVWPDRDDGGTMRMDKGPADDGGTLRMDKRPAASGASRFRPSPLLIGLGALAAVALIAGAIYAGNAASIDKSVALSLYGPSATSTNTSTATTTPTPTVTPTATITPTPTITPTASAAPINTGNIGFVGALYVIDAGPILDMALSPDGKRLAVATGAASAAIYDVESEQTISLSGGHDGGVNAVAWSPDGKRLATGGGDGNIVIWDAETGQNLQKLEGGHTDTVTTVIWPLDDNIVISGSLDRQVVFWDVSAGEIKLHNTFQAAVAGLVPSHDGTRVATIIGENAFSGNGHVWETETGYPQIELSPDTSKISVLAVGWSPDGARVAGGLDDSILRVWDAKTGGRLMSLTGHSGPVTAVAFSGDNQWIASGSTDERVVVWNAATGERVTTLREHTGTITRLLWTADSTILLSGSSDGKIILWAVRP